MSAIKAAFNKASSQYDDYAFLQKEIAMRLDEKLQVISQKPQLVVDLGAGTGLLTKPLLKRFPAAKIIALDFAEQTLKHNPAEAKICADAMQIPLKNNSVDVLISNLMLQWCEDLDAVFSECHRVLKNNGLLIFSTFGVDTLQELKKSWAVADDKIHINTFIDMHQIGDRLLQNGFASPVMEMETLTMTYATVRDLLKDLKGIGAQSVAGRSKSLTGKGKFELMLKMYESYRKNGKLPATFEVIYGHGWKLTNPLGVPLETLK